LKNYNIIGIIPARGGSKGILRKNIVKLNKKPLIYYSISEAKKSKFLSKVVVSTEDVEIANVAKKFDVCVIKRPKNLASDKSQSIDTIKHTIHFLEKQNKSQIDIIVFLQPTSPLRTTEDIDKAISKFIKSKCDSLISVNETSHSPYFMYTLKNNFLKPLLKISIRSKRRQDMPKIFQVNGAIYITSRDMILKKNTVFGKKILPFVMDVEKSIDIDSSLDLIVAEHLLKLRE
jgi:CMP-N,N'-diacetyllegionaminic acid synthase